MHLVSDLQLTLTKYERDNLLALLHAVAHRGGPLSAANSGDWVMQIAYKLGWKGEEETDWGTPNRFFWQLDQDARRLVGTALMAELGLTGQWRFL